MKKLLALVLLAGCVSCGLQVKDDKDNKVDVENPFSVSSPQPTTPLTKLSLTQEETAYVAAGNTLAFKLFNLLGGGTDSFVLSPLSIQYALGMTANGASGETLTELVQALGFEDGNLDALNAYCHKLLNELPALDLNVTLKLADALLVNSGYPLLPAFQKTVEDTYYAVVDNMSFSDPEKVAGRINDWSSRNTNGLIDKMLDASEIHPDAIAYLMNALYFKARWLGGERNPLFQEYATYEQEFYLGGNLLATLPTMHASGYFRYADMGSYGVLELPYDGEKFAMYILLPHSKADDDKQLVRDFPTLDWAQVLSSLKQREVILSLPKFEIASSYSLKDALQSLGVEQAFGMQARFDRMFANPDVDAYISKVIQKARIAVAEWGTEAAAVTVVEMAEKSSMPSEDIVRFTCDHPFAWLIAECSSGVVLFEGAYRGN